MKQKPTPWIVQGTFRDTFMVVEDDGSKGYRLVAEIERKEDAVRTAASGDLLVALEALLTPSVEASPELWHQAKQAGLAAIKKARGES